MELDSLYYSGLSSKVSASVIIAIASSYLALANYMDKKRERESYLETMLSQ